jgi:hypothetical protein
MSRIFVPGKGFASRARVDRVAEVDVLTRRSPSGRRSLPTSGAGPGSQGWPGGPSAASRAAASLTARNSAATREIASDQLPMERGSVARAHPRSGRVASSVVSVCRASQVTRSHGRKPKPDHIDAERAPFPHLCNDMIGPRGTRRRGSSSAGSPTAWPVGLLSPYAVEGVADRTVRWWGTPSAPVQDTPLIG